MQPRSGEKNAAHGASRRFTKREIEQAPEAGKQMPRRSLRRDGPFSLHLSRLRIRCNRSLFFLCLQRLIRIFHSFSANQLHCSIQLSRFL